MSLRRTSRILAIVLSVMLVLTGMPLSEVAAATVGDGSMATGYVKIEETKKTIAPGISDKKITMNTESGGKQNIVFACEVDMSVGTTGVMAGYKNYNGSSLGLQTTTDQAAAAEKKTGKNVVAAINADYFDMTTGATMGALVMDGTVYSQANDRPYFAVLKDGSAVIRDGSVPLDDVKEAVGGWPQIVKDGKFIISPTDGGYDNIPYSRTAIGVKENGNVVALTTHGRINPVSYGMTMFEMAEVLMGQGCKDVLILDGGGSSTYCAQYEGEDELAVVNNPSDGKERMVSSTLLFTSSAKPTGEFDHAVIEPNNEVYTPGSTVKFTATGVDSSGTAVDMPEGLTWRLAAGSERMGEIDANTGEFTANENVGEVAVELVQNGQAVGSTSITVAQPDSISFTNEELCLGFNKQSDLGLTVKYKGRNVNYKAGDFKWTLTPDDESAAPEDMGTFDGNIFTSSEGKSVNGKIRCESVWDANVAGELYAIIGRLPTVAMDFEDQVDEDGNVITDASTYWLGKEAEDTNGDGVADTEAVSGQITTKTYDRGGKESLSLVNVADDEEHVRFGSNALKIDYDFTQAWGTEGAGVGYTSNQTIEGTPTAVGMWVYAPEGTANLWLRIRVNDADGQVQNLDFVPEIDKSISDIIKDGNNWTGDKSLLGGISWEGWHYVEAPLTDKEGNPLKAPFELRTGEVIRVMYVPGTGMGMALPDGTYVGQAERKGSLYIDNVRFVYGANVDDLDAPKAEFININDTTFENDTKVDTNTVTIKASLYDEPGAYMSGLDWERIHTYIDGKEVKFDQAGELLQISNLGLGNGDHEFKLVISDKFGNKTTETRSFTVKGDSDFTTIEAGRVTDGDVLLNSTQVYEFTTNHGEKVGTFSADVQLNKIFAEDTLKLTFNDAVEGTSKYDADTGILHIEGTVKDGAELSGSTKLATLECYIPSTTANGVKYRVSVKNGSYTLKSEVSQVTTFSAKEFSADVKATYSVSADVLVAGSTDGYLYAYDADGNPVSNVELYLEDGTRIGVTGEKGYVRAKNLSTAAGTYSVYAVKDGQYSFLTKIVVQAGVGNEDGYPTQVTSVVTDDPSSEKAVTWFSNPDAADKVAIMQIAPTAEYEAKGEAAFKDYEGTSKKHSFTGSSDASRNGTVLINKVHATGLDYDVEYTYRVGDGNYWSDVNTFTLRRTGTDTNLFIVGDMQSEDTTNVDRIFNNLADSGINFNAGIQTGDLVDSGAVFTNWTSALNVFSKNAMMSSTEMLHAIGNHEREGDSELVASQSIFNMPDANHYSVEYGNVYVATLSYAFSRTQLEEDLAWLIQDAQKSDALWKVVVTHQPAYYTNTAGSNELMHELLPAAAEEAGIDFVFSGHDHSYARTEPLKGGEVNKEDGVVYYICGSTGEKSYSISDNKDFHFAELNDSFEAIYLTINATDEAFTVQTHELDGSVIDEYVKESDSSCMEDGHEYVYDGGAYLVCDACKYVSYEPKYTGIVKDAETGREMYLIKGTAQTGWQTYGADKVYYFDANGLSCEVTKTEDIETTCTTRGYKLYECKAAPEGEQEYKISYVKAPGHSYDENRVCTECGWKERDFSKVKVTLTSKTYKYTGKEIKVGIKLTDGDRQLKRYVDYDIVGYENNVKVGTASITVKAHTRYIGDAVNARGNYAPGEQTIEFKIVPRPVTKVTASENKTSSVKLTWNKSTGATGYKIYRYSADKKKYVLHKTVSGGNTTSTVCKQLKYAKRYTFKVVPRALVKENGKNVEYTGNYAKCYTATRPTQSKITRLTAGTKSMTVKWSKRTCTGYHIIYARNSSFKNAKNIYISNDDTVSRKITKLTAGKYYVKVRAYKTTTKGVKVYGLYSPYKTVRVK